jgi:hypothetical protein
MSQFSIWDPKKNDDYRFLDETIREMFHRGGMAALIHKYIGIHDQGENGDATQPSAAKSKLKKERQIQDLLFLENRDRHYAPDLFEIRAVYNMQDNEYNMSQFGLFVDSDTFYIEIHLNECLERIGRKLMSGDVLEFPHLRDDALLDEDSPAINKYYQITDVNRAAGGWSPTWRPHILRIKVKPMTAGQEFNDILDREVEGEFNVRDLIGDWGSQMGINQAILEQAESDVQFRNFQTAHFYVVPGEEDSVQYPWIFAGDGEPPNGAELAGSGTNFPEDPADGAWFLNTGHEPNVLYQRSNGVWRRKEVDLKKKWNAAHRILQSFINNDNITNNQGNNFAEKQNLSKVVKPRADF